MRMLVIRLQKFWLGTSAVGLEKR